MDYLNLRAAWGDPDSRLHMNRRDHRYIRAFLAVALAKPYIDAVEWLMLSPGTYIAALVADIRRSVLEPYLWEGSRLCGIPHRGIYRYGVRHGVHSTDEETTHYHLGMIHRIGAPAVIAGECYSYYRNDRTVRESGPIHVGPGHLEYPTDAPIQMMSCNGPRFLRFRIVEITDYGDVFTIYWNYDRSADLRRFQISQGVLTLITDPEVSVAHPIFEYLCIVLEQYLTDYPIEAECDREWHRSRAELSTSMRSIEVGVSE